jgi:hypothetical protein
MLKLPARSILVGLLGAFGLALGGCSSVPSQINPDGGMDGGNPCSNGEVAGETCDVTLQAPLHGLQFKVGPYPVPAGTEVLRCYWRKVTEDIAISQIEVAYNKGSHHIDIYAATGYDVPDGDFDCSRPEEWGGWGSQMGKGNFDGTRPLRLFVGFQNDAINWALPDGTAYKLKKGQQLLIQSHFANGVTQKTPTARLLDYINFHSTDASKVINEAETLFDEDTELNLPPHAATTVTRYCVWPQEVNLIGMFGHFHSRGQHFRVWQFDPDTGTQGDMIYENDVWDSPPWMTVNDWGGAIKTKAIKMTSDYFNDTDNTIVWGYYVGVNEHFETYSMYYPALQVDAECICNREGEAPEAVVKGTEASCNFVGGYNPGGNTTQPPPTPPTP